ncbi:hypothetical protein KW459_16075 [Vibrio fluvialis]|nr:hypothetical protein [Vibrio fluvialis]
MKQPKTDKEKSLDAQANQEISNYIKSEMKRFGVNNVIVAERLTHMGRPITAQGLRNKISNGTHQTTWYWDLIKAIRIKETE